MREVLDPRTPSAATPGGSDVPLPEVSVVMGVYDDPPALLDRAVKSVLDQEGVRFEFVIVNDGSGPVTTELLRSWAARDVRIRLLDQGNEGLTSALCRGCGAARAPIVVRQDADDVSLPGRLEALRTAFSGSDQLVLASSWAECLAPRGELMFVATAPEEGEAARNGVLRERRGPPCHGSAAFRRDAYETVGGYRRAFRHGQDSDLWHRLAQLGTVRCLPRVYYRYTFRPDGISGARAKAQAFYGELGQACLAARLAGMDDEPLLRRASEFRARPARWWERPTSNAEYFIGSCLLNRRDPAALHYLWASLRGAPWRLRTAVKVVLAIGLRLVRGPRLAGTDCGSAFVGGRTPRP